LLSGFTVILALAGRGRDPVAPADGAAPGAVGYLRSLYPPEAPIAIVMDNDSPHVSAKEDIQVGEWAAANNLELPSVPTNASFLNRIKCHLTALRYFALNGADHRSHEEQNSMIRRYIA
jgi:hypothetical protein